MLCCLPVPVPVPVLVWQYLRCAWPMSHWAAVTAAAARSLEARWISPCYGKPPTLPAPVPGFCFLALEHVRTLVLAPPSLFLAVPSSLARTQVFYTPTSTARFSSLAMGAGCERWTLPRQAEVITRHRREHLIKHVAVFGSTKAASLPYAHEAFELHSFFETVH